jgi:hypothetical protein
MFHHKSRKNRGSILASLFLLGFSAQAADVNVLIVADKSNPSADIRTQLQNILEGTTNGTVNVTLENTHPGFSNGGRNLATWLHETDYSSETTHLARLANLRGESGTVWDYVVLLEDRETIEKYPGQYCVGVSDIVKEVNRGTNGTEVVLMAQWPATVSTNRVNTVDYYKEVTYRVGRSLGLKVAPAGMAWEAAGSPADTTQQSYIAAASIYSRIWNQSAADSTYTYNDPLAQTAFTTVTNNVGQPQYSGAFVAPIGIYDMGHVNNSREYVIYPEYYGRGSTEGGFVSAGAKMLTAARLCYAGGTGGAITRIAPVGNASSFAAHWTSHQAQGDEIFAKYYYMDYYLDGGSSYGADYYASRMASGYPHIRHWPEILMFAQYMRENSYNIMAPGQHISTASVMLRNAFLITLKTGRCPLPAGPANYGERYWDAVRIGYETAWRMGTLQGRVPGFKTLPSNRVRWTVDEVAPETMQVYFLYPPKSNVTVTVSTTESFASVSPQTLTFTPSNYATVQNVTVSVAPGTAPATPFTVAYSTSSQDEVYDGLEESWDYQVNRRPIADDQSITAYSGFPKEIYFTGSNPDADLLRQHVHRNNELGLPPEEEVLYNEAHGYRIINAPSNGTIKILGRGDDVTYTADEGYTGPDSFTFVRYDWHPNSISEEATVTINVEPQPLYNFNLLKNGEASLTPLNEFHWTTQSGDWGTGTDDEFKYTATGLLYQDVDVADYAFDIDDGRQVFTFSGDWRTTTQWGPYDDFRFILEFRGATNQLLGTSDSGMLGYTLNNAPPELYQRNAIAPAGTRSIRVIMQATRNGNNSYIADNLSLVAKSALNSVPVADYQSGVVASAGVTNTITLTASDADADALTYIIVDQPQYGTVTVNGTGPTVSYVPNAGYLGPDSFTFKVNDIRDDSNVATIETIVVANVGPSVAIDSPTRDTVAIPYNVGVLLEATVIDDGAPTPATITWSKVSGPGAVTFESPNAADTAVNFNNVQGVYVLQLTADDGEYSASDTVTIEVGYYDASKDMASHVIIDHHAVGTPGVAIAIDGLTIADDGLPNPPATVAINWELLSGPGNAVLSDPTIPNPTVTCDTAGQYIYRVSAFDGATKTYNDLSVTISGSGNLPPVAQNQTVEVDPDSTDNPITLTSTDAEGDPRTYAIVSQPTHGSVTLIGSGPQATYTPTAGYGGNDSFTFKANDGADSAPATVTIKVKTPPVVNAGPDQVVYKETIQAFVQDSGTQGLVSIEAEHYSENINAANKAWVELSDSNASGGVAMDSAPDENVAATGPVTMTYRVNFVKTGTHYFWVRGRAYPRSGDAGTADSVFGGLDGVATGSISGFATNYVWSRALQAGGVATINVTTPGVHSVEVRMREDGFVCDKIVLTTDSGYTPSGAGPAENESVIVASSINLDGTVTDANGDALTTAWTVTEGVATINNPAAIDTIASVTDAGFYTFRLTADDGTYQPYDEVRIELRTIDTNNAAPVAQDQSIRVDRNSAANAIVLAATDAEGDALTYAVVNPPTNGTLSGTAPNLTYTPTTSFTGSDSFTFFASDFQQPSAPGTVTIMVNSPPVVNAGDPQTVAINTSNVRAWTPAELSPAAWYAADDASTITESAGAVSQWNDKSGNGNHAVQSTASLQPITGATNLNGLNVIDFTDDGLDVSYSTLAQPYFMMAVLSVSTGSYAWDGKDGAHRHAYYNVGSDTSAEGVLYAGVGANPGVAVPTDSPYIAGCLYNGTNSARTVNGESPIVVNAGTHDSAGLVIGQRYSHTAGITGYFGEFLVIDEDPQEETRQLLEGYLAWKWGLTNNLPVDHPYKSATLPLVGGVDVSITGAAYDPDGEAFTTTWSLASTQPAGLNAPTFEDASALNTTANFTEVGQYTLKLSATDTMGVTGESTVVITVSDGTNITHTVTVSTPARGTITPGGAVQVAHGGSTNFVITPDSHYSISSVLANGVNVPVDNPAGFTYTWSNITASGTFDATFIRRKTNGRNVSTEWLEATVPTSTNDYDAAEMDDPDGDGFETWKEYWTGTDPMDGNSYFKLDGIHMSGTNVVLQWRHALVDPDILPITIIATDDLSGSWTPIGAWSPQNGMNIWTNSSATYLYYRICVTNAL